MNELDLQAKILYAEDKGREEGRELGREEARLSIARKFPEAGTPADVIATCTGLDKSVIEAIAKESGKTE